jgi:molybdate transport system ATP-binding protein
MVHQVVVNGSGLIADLLVRRGAFMLDIQLHAAAGEVVALLGPNGAGKSTAVRALAGLLPITGGRVAVAGVTVAEEGIHRPPYERPIGVVFQDYLLFPHLSVLDNVAFGPRTRGQSRHAARRIAAGWLERMAIAELASAQPRSISGGQAQRVALARALATDPQLLLLDEPLAALDARTRLVVRSELRRHLADYGGATVLVTHDPIDAGVLADRLVVIESGRVVQSGSPAEIARRPRTDYVARLVGLNLLTGVASGHLVTLPGGGTVQLAVSGTGPAYVAFAPAAVALFSRRPEGSPRNVWPGLVSSLEPHGAGVRVEIAGAPDAGSSILAEITPAAVAELGIVPGSSMWVAVKASDIDIYPDRAASSA